MQTNSPTTIPATLRKEWIYHILGSLLLFGLLFSVLSAAQSSGYNMQWGAQTVVVFFFFALYLRRILSENHRNDETTILPTFGSGTWLTLLRGTLIATIFGFYFLPEPIGYAAWLPAILYTIAGLTDFFDGWLARISNHSTALGQRLDMDMDAIGLLSITGLVFQYGKVPWWYLLFGFARYLFLFGLWLRKKQGKNNGEMGVNVLRRWLAALQMGYIAVVVYPLIRPPGTLFAASLFLIPFAGSFIYDWLFVIQHEKKGYFRYLEKVGQWVARHYSGIALFMRMSVFLLVLVWLNDHDFSAITFWVAIGLSILTLSGVLVRATTIFFLVLIGLTNTMDNFNWAVQLLLVFDITLATFGSGKYSLWNPEDWLVWNRAGD